MSAPDPYGERHMGVMSCRNPQFGASRPTLRLIWTDGNGPHVIECPSLNGGQFPLP
jgi:hypothetical protein